MSNPYAHPAPCLPSHHIPDTPALPWTVLALLLPGSIVELLADVDMGDSVEIRSVPSLGECDKEWIEGDGMVRARMGSQTLKVLDQVPLIHFGDLATLVGKAFQKERAGAAVRRELSVVLNLLGRRGKLHWDGSETGHVWRPGHDRSLRPHIALPTAQLPGLCRVPVEELAGAIWLLAARCGSGDLNALLRDVLVLYRLSRKGHLVDERLEEALQLLRWQCPHFQRSGGRFRCDSRQALAA